MPAALPDRSRCSAEWFRSSYSTGMNNCVEAARHVPGGLAVRGSTALAVRDSKAPEGAVLRFGAAAWTAFLHTLVTREGHELV